MRCRSFALLLVLYTLTTFAAELPAQNPTPASIARQRFNQVFVKVIMPVTVRTPKQDGPAVESWVAEQLKELGESEYFAVTDWVPVCDGLLEDDEVDNRVWDGSLGNASFCPVGGGLPERLPRCDPGLPGLADRARTGAAHDRVFRHRQDALRTALRNEQPAGLAGDSPVQPASGIGLPREHLMPGKGGKA